MLIASSVLCTISAVGVVLRFGERAPSTAELPIANESGDYQSIEVFTEDTNT